MLCFIRSTLWGMILGIIIYISLLQCSSAISSCETLGNLLKQKLLQCLSEYWSLVVPR